MYRRDFLAVTAAALGMTSVAGCLGSLSTPDDGEAPAQSPTNTTPTQTPTPSTPGGETPTQTPTPSTPQEETPTQTPVLFPDTCQPLPDINGLPARPAELTEESVRSYVTEFERVYAVATKSEYGGIASLQVTETETIGDRYCVQLEIKGEPATPTPGPGKSTPTLLPADAYTHKVLYRLEDDRMVRVLLTYPAEAPLSSDCWILSASETQSTTSKLPKNSAATY